MIDHYDWAGGREAMLRFGPAGGPVVVAALPLFEEANRTRSFVVTILRLLAARGIAGALPVGIDESASSWCFVKLGSSVEIARPVVVSEKGDSRVSRKWERLALRGSIVVLSAWALVGVVLKGAVGV